VQPHRDNDDEHRGPVCRLECSTSQNTTAYHFATDTVQRGTGSPPERSVSTGSAVPGPLNLPYNGHHQRYDMGPLRQYPTTVSRLKTPRRATRHPSERWFADSDCDEKRKE